MEKPTEPCQAIKDPESAHPIPDEWRPTLGRVVSAFAQRDYRLERGIELVDEVSPATADQIEAFIAAYGESLVELPDETWDSSIAQWMGAHWDVVVDLWTEGEGQSDLVLAARVREAEWGYRFSVQLVHVP